MTEVKKAEIAPTEFQLMDRKDEELIIQEMTGKEYLENFVYSFKQGGRTVTNLSYAGVKEAVRERGHFAITDFKLDETDKTYFAVVKVHDKIADVDALGTAEADKDKPFARVLALNKAERNAYSKLLPAKLFAEMIKKKIGENPRTVVDVSPQPEPIKPTPEQPKIPDDVCPCCGGKKNPKYEVCWTCNEREKAAMEGQ